ncbi:MAG: hypothetical protein Q8Q92_03735 [bacterium]|nr:hypothetical protein [bacterium]
MNMQNPYEDLIKIIDIILRKSAGDAWRDRKPVNKIEIGQSLARSQSVLRALHAFRTAIWQIPGNILARP